MNFFRLSAALAVLCAIGACSGAAPGTVGAGLGLRSDHRLFVRSLPPGEGGDRAGLQVDDEILLIDGKDVRPMTEEDVRQAVRGDVGSPLVLTVLRGTEKLDVKVVRSPLLAPGRGR